MPDHLEWPLGHARLNNHWHHICWGIVIIIIVYIFFYFIQIFHLLAPSPLSSQCYSGFWFRHWRHFSDFSIQPRGLDRKRMKSASTEWFLTGLALYLTSLAEIPQDISGHCMPGERLTIQAFLQFVLPAKVYHIMQVQPKQCFSHSTSYRSCKELLSFSGKLATWPFFVKKNSQNNTSAITWQWANISHWKLYQTKWKIWLVALRSFTCTTKTTSVIYNFTMLSQAYVPFSRYFNSEALESYFVLPGH